MLPERVDEMLRDYREFSGRCAYLETLIQSLDKEIEIMNGNEFYENIVPLGGQALDGMPHGSSVGNPTEQIGIMLADGHKPDYIVEKERELADAKQEYEYKYPTVVFVNAWLKGLTDRERWIIENQVIDGVSWRELTSEHLAKYGETRTKRSLQLLRDKALGKIYRMAS